MIFTDRRQAGLLLAKKLQDNGAVADIVLGLARGGVIVSSVISKMCAVVGDVLVVKKIGSPGNAELAVGALAPGGVFYLDDRLARETDSDKTYIESKIMELGGEIQKKTNLYRKGKPALSVEGMVTILTDDGAATGATMYAAVKWARVSHAKKVTVTLPVAPPDVADRLKTMADEVMILETAADFGAVGEFYKNFSQVSDEDVIKLLT